MKAIRKNDHFYFELSDVVYDKDGNEYQFKELMLVPDDDEEVLLRPSDEDTIRLRQEYAGRALQAILGNSNSTVFAAFKERAVKEHEDIHQTIAKGALEWADALIRELGKYV